MMKGRARALGLEGVTQTGPQGPLGQQTCPFAQSEDLEHFFWQVTDCGLAGVGQGDTSGTDPELAEQLIMTPSTERF